MIINYGIMPNTYPSLQMITGQNEIFLKDTSQTWSRWRNSVRLFDARSGEGRIYQVVIGYRIRAELLCNTRLAFRIMRHIV